ncbi:MAG: glucose-6-phosphate dehydrogenase [Agarilytica sp.]
MNTDLLIVGGDGDLALRKLYPSLYCLELNECEPEYEKIIGVARTAHEREGFLAKVKTYVIASISEKYFSEEIWQVFAAKLCFVQCDATDANNLAAVKDNVVGQDAALVVYLAIPPLIFGRVVLALENSGLVTSTTRLVVEKPLGDSHDSFIEINKELTRVFPEEQLFRIDHYLGKETVQNLLALRFANDIFEPLWNAKYIDHIQITVSESVGVGGRRAFYDQTGATRDMIQNHLLQVLCLVAMEPPATLNAECVRVEKLKVLQCLKPFSTKDVGKNTVRGQYHRGMVNGDDVVGYLEEEQDKENSNSESDTETYVALQTEIHNWRWTGVPIYLRTGKRLQSQRSEIVVQFKQSHHQIFDQNHSEHKPNRLVIRLQPDEGIRLRIMNKVAGLEAGIPLESGCLDIQFGDGKSGKKDKKHDAYSRLLFDVLRNDQTLFVSASEVEQAWCWIDQIFEAWAQTGMKSEAYMAGSFGPPSADVLIARSGRAWHNLLAD